MPPRSLKLPFNTTEELRRVLTISSMVARRRRERLAGIHLLHVLLHDYRCTARLVLEQTLPLNSRLGKQLADEYGLPLPVPRSNSRIGHSAEAARIVRNMGLAASGLGHVYHGSEHLLLGIVTEFWNEGAWLLLDQEGVSIEYIYETVKRVLEGKLA